MRGSCVVVALCLALVAIGCQAADDAPVRKSDSAGICHDPASPNYMQLKNYTSYPTLRACLDSGGKLRKGATEPPGAGNRSRAILDTDDPTIVKMSRSAICYDSGNARFESICNYAAYRTMKDCLEEGGRLPQ